MTLTRLFLEARTVAFAPGNGLTGSSRSSRGVRACARTTGRVSGVGIAVRKQNPRFFRPDLSCAPAVKVRPSGTIPRRVY